MGESITDKELVKNAQKGDSRAFDILVTRYQSRVLTLVGKYVHSREDAKDVAQEAFIKAYRALPNFRGDSAFYTWLYRISVNTAKNFLVARGRRPPSSDVDAQDAEFYGGESRLKDQDSPERHLLSDEIGKTVSEAISALPEDLRMAIVLREVEGMTYDEIAEIMDCPIGTVRSRIFRARDAIDTKIRPLMDQS
ncbi:MAG: RNA polymerase sigma factor RpoE [bacterium]